MSFTFRTRPALFTLFAAALLFIACAPAANAAQKSVAANQIHGGTAVFNVAGVGADEIRGAKLNVAGYRKRLGAGTVRRAAQRGTLGVRLPRRVVRRLTHSGAQASSGRSSRWPRLTILTRRHVAALAKGTPVAESTSSFETGDFSEFTSLQNKFGSLSVVGNRAYDGTKSARATWQGGPQGAQRVWQDTDWNVGSEVWYGMAAYVPQSSDYCYWNPMRWDNYDLYGGVDDNTPGTGDVGGLTVDHNNISIMRNTYGGEEQTILEGGTLPKGRWTWIEVHQKLSNVNGQALSELYIDGQKRGASTKANMNGRKITDLRAGVVNVASECSKPDSIDFDRVTISNHQIGPLARR